MTTVESQSMAELQLEGIAAIYNILCKHGFAYLADEVGMGKTYQALGLVSACCGMRSRMRAFCSSALARTFR